MTTRADPALVRNGWVAQPGSQVLFLSCPVFEALYEGTRGPGKTDTLLMDFAQHTGRGFGSYWRGVLFRRTYKELEDAVAKSQRWFPRLFGAKWIGGQEHKWKFPGGEELLFRHFMKPSDYWSYHGHEYPWIGWEELTAWPDDKCFKSMISCCRSSRPGMPRKYRATTNPYGKGHNWVKRRYQLPQMRGRVIRTPGEPDRVAIHGRLSENRILLEADPDYEANIRAAAANPMMAQAWLDGSWDITSGGMFDDVWDSRVHVVEPFVVPASWRVDRALDWGQTKPFAVQWWAESDGSDVLLPSKGRRMRTVRGDLFLIGQWYGCKKGEENVGLNMSAIDIADGVKAREAAMGLAGRVRPGPADTGIFDDDDNGRSIARDMESRGVRWVPADKGPGSRNQGWVQVRQYMKGSLPPEGGGPRELPGLFVFRTCTEWLRVVPSISRSEKDPDDVDTDAEDHDADCTRYRVRRRRRGVMQGSTR